MKVLFFTRLFYPHIGGVEKHILEISRILLKKGYSVVVVAERNDPNIKSEEMLERIQIYRINVGKNNWIKKFRIWKWLFNNRDLIKKADIVHCHDVFFWYLPFRFLYPLKKIFTTFHGYESYPLKKKYIFNHKMSEILSMGNICIGDYIAKWYGTKPNYVMYGAINLPKKENKNRLDEERIKVVYVGRLEEDAGIMIYLRALKLLKNKGYNIKLTVLGDGVQREQAEQFCKKNNLKVIFKGFVKNTYHYLSVSDFVFTSRFMSTLEALSAKRFAFVAQTSEINNDCFKLSPFLNFISLNKNETDLVNSFIYNLGNKGAMYAKIQAGYNWVKKQVWENVVQAYLSLWNSHLIKSSKV